jgi:UDP-N-acetylmuramoyl-tripeptide--D-alanyl-D-alanine ligase
MGCHNIYNAMMATAIARLFGMEYKDIAARLTQFEFPESRLNLIEFNNTKFIDDTYNSNPLSLKDALDALNNFRTKGRKIFVMGDMLELGNDKELFHRKAGQEAARFCDAIVTVGKLSEFAAQAASKSGFDSKNIFICESNLQARDILFKRISPGPADVVLVKGSRSMKMEEVFRK